MTRLEELLIEQEMRKATPIYDGDNESGYDERMGYVENAKLGYIISFNFYFNPKSDENIKLKKVISGKILENNKEDRVHIVETKNKLKYKVPYEAVTWVKTGKRWPKGIYEEMKKGTVRIDDNDDNKNTEAYVNDGAEISSEETEQKDLFEL